MDKYIDLNKLLEDIEHNVVFTLRPDKPSSINAELRGANKIIDRIRCAPAVDMMEVRHGEWKSHHYKAGPLDMWGWECSVCGGVTPVDVSNYLYCPRCAARMDGGDDNG